MPNTISAAYRAHLDSLTTTLCMLVKIVTLSNESFGFADFERDLIFDDGTGSLTYKSRFGMSRSNISTTSNTAVDNAEFDGLIADLASDGFTLSDIRSRKFDFAAFSIYRVNYKDLGQGLMWLGNGKLGNIAIQQEAYEAEFRSLTQLLKQRAVVEVTSKTCRYVFGDTRCGVDVDALTQTGSVVTVIDPSFSFTIDVIEADGFYVPGHIEFTTGNNTQIIGIQGALGTEIKLHASDTVTLTYPTPNAIQVGDQFKIRENCEKTPADCKKFINFPRNGSEPDIPTKDGAAIVTPYASSKLSPSGQN